MSEDREENTEELFDIGEDTCRVDGCDNTITRDMGGVCPECRNSES